MDVHRVIADLREERACLDETVIGLEKLLLKRAPRRGRPPLWSSAKRDTAPKKEKGANGALKQPARTMGASLQS